MARVPLEFSLNRRSARNQLLRRVTLTSTRPVVWNGHVQSVLNHADNLPNTVPFTRTNITRVRRNSSAMIREEGEGKRRSCLSEGRFFSVSFGDGGNHSPFGEAL